MGDPTRMGKAWARSVSILSCALVAVMCVALAAETEDKTKHYKWVPDYPLAPAAGADLSTVRAQQAGTAQKIARLHRQIAAEAPLPEAPIPGHWEADQQANQQADQQAAQRQHVLHEQQAQQDQPVVPLPRPQLVPPIPLPREQHGLQDALRDTTPLSVRVDEANYRQHILQRDLARYQNGARLTEHRIQQLGPNPKLPQAPAPSPPVGAPIDWMANCLTPPCPSGVPGSKVPSSGWKYDTSVAVFTAVFGAALLTRPHRMAGAVAQFGQALAFIFAALGHSLYSEPNDCAMIPHYVVWWLSFLAQGLSVWGWLRYCKNVAITSAGTEGYNAGFGFANSSLIV